jgi:serine/threonine protein kinase
VADFGLSKATSGQSMNSRMGSLNWCAPEILQKSSAYSPEADSYGNAPPYLFFRLQN